jgi:hypothetical protein
MAQGTQQFTPAQILEAGRRAEMEGRVEYAIQFYRHLTDHMPRTLEASAAEQALLRLGGQTATNAAAGAGTTNGHYHGAASMPSGSASSIALPYGTAAGTRTAASSRSTAVALSEPEEAVRRKAAVPRLRRRYRTGRFVARVLTFLGFFEIGVGTLILCAAGLTLAGITLPGLPLALAGQPALMAVSAGAGLIVVGGLLVLAGQLARALFDQASSTRDLAAMWRARAGFGTGAQNRAAPDA